MPPSFTWDKRKAAANLRQHGVSFAEAETVFANPLAVIFDDPVHSGEDRREIIVGHSTGNRLLLVCFTERWDGIRIISARCATPENSVTMKKASNSNPQADDSEEMLAEYAFDYEKARPNRFVPKIEDGSLIVVLEPDIARVFTTPESVKKVLRALIETMPETADTHTP